MPETTEIALIATHEEHARWEALAARMLASWGVSNLLAGTLLVATGRGAARGFGQAGAGWGAVNTALGVVRVLGLRGEPTPRTVPEAIGRHIRLERLVAGFFASEIALVLAGIALARRRDPVARGWGQGLIAQNAWLLMFDAVLLARTGGHIHRLLGLLGRARQAGEERSGAPDPFAPLRGQRYMALTTYRTNGEAVSTAVGFAELGDALYVETSPASGKAKRIRRDGRARVAPSTGRGAPTCPAVPATARVLGEGEAPEEAAFALRTKYRRARALGAPFGFLRGFGDHPNVEIRPAEGDEATTP